MKHLTSSLLSILFLFLSIASFSQENSLIESYDAKKNKWFYGSDVGLSFLSRRPVIELKPFIGYKINDKFSVGLQVPFEKMIGKRPILTSYWSVGLGAFLRYKITDQFFLYGDYNQYYVSLKGDFWAPEGRVNSSKNWAGESNIGIGYRTKGKWGIEAKLNYGITKSNRGLGFRIGLSHKF